MSLSLKWLKQIPAPLQSKSWPKAEYICLHFLSPLLWLPESVRSIFPAPTVAQSGTHGGHHGFHATVVSGAFPVLPWTCSTISQSWPLLPSWICFWLLWHPLCLCSFFPTRSSPYAPWWPFFLYLIPKSWCAPGFQDPTAFFYMLSSWMLPYGSILEKAFMDKGKIKVFLGIQILKAFVCQWSWLTGLLK